jgi:polyketide synthase 13
MAAQKLMQEATLRAGRRRARRGPAERVTPGVGHRHRQVTSGIFNALPAIDDETAEKMAQRLERAEGPSPPRRLHRPTIEALAPWCASTRSR